MAIGTRVAVAYANLFMGRLEDLHIKAHHRHVDKISVYRHFIDDLFFIWNGMEQELIEFSGELNKNDWGIKFTLKYSTKEIYYREKKEDFRQQIFF